MADLVRRPKGENLFGKALVSLWHSTAGTYRLSLTWPVLLSENFNHLFLGHALVVQYRKANQLTGSCVTPVGVAILPVELLQIIFHLEARIRMINVVIKRDPIYHLAGNSFPTGFVKAQSYAAIL